MDKPIILDPAKESDKNTILDLKKSGVTVVDEMGEQLKELSLVRNPGILTGLTPEESDGKADTVWVYYSWRNCLVHCLNEKDFQLLRRSRNKYLIPDDGQVKFDGAVIGIAGLNVGNPGAVCIALEGQTKMKLADNDVLSVSNLNRFRAGLPDLGINKAILSARQIWEINPFAGLEVFDGGITQDNISDFLLKPRISVLIEEMDNLPLKIRIRELARENKIPVIMVTGNGENIIIDIERFDLDSDLPLLSGYLKDDIVDAVKAGPKSFDEKIKLARDFMGVKYLHPKLAESFDFVGKKIPGIPQIAESSFLRGAALAYVARRIIQGDKMESGRFNLELSDVQGSKNL